MKTILIISLFFLAFASAKAQQTYVPDDSLEQALIYMGLDSPPLNDSVPTKNIDTLTYLNVGNKYISDLTGIEDFTALTELGCYRTNLTSLDLSKNTALEELYCHENHLVYLDISGCKNLKILDCTFNKLTNLDVSNNTALEELYCYTNHILNLDVSFNTTLTNFNCSANNLTSLDVSKNTSLTIFGCSANNLTSLDVSKNSNLESLLCTNNALTNLDVSKNSALKYLFCYDNALTSLDVSKNTDLIHLWCDNNALTSLNVKNGNNINMMITDISGLSARNNPNLYCIQVDDKTFADTVNSWYKDSHAVYSEDCSLVSVVETTTDNIGISPNPASDFIEVGGLEGVHGLMIYDVLGNVVIALGDELRWSNGTRFRGNDILVSSEGNVRIDVSSLSPGVYFVRVGGNMYKFVKI